MNISQNAWGACGFGLGGAVAAWRAQRRQERAFPSAVDATVASEHPKTCSSATPRALPTKEATGRPVAGRFRSLPAPSSFCLSHLLFFTLGFVTPSAAGSPLRSSSNPTCAGGNTYEAFWRARLKAEGFCPLSSPLSRGTKFF